MTREELTQAIDEYFATHDTKDHNHTNDKVLHSDLLGLNIDDHDIYIKADGTRAFTGEQSMGTNKLTNVVDPSADQDAATKKYVDDNETISEYYGDGSDGALAPTAATNFNQVQSDLTVAAASGQKNFEVTSGASFAVGDKVLMHQARGTGAGLWEIGTIASKDVNKLIMRDNLVNTYTPAQAGDTNDRAYASKISEHTLVTLKTGTTMDSPEWNGTTGGVCIFYASQGVIIEDDVTLSMNGFGFRGGTTDFYQGEGSAGAGTEAITANGNGGGGGQDNPPGYGGGGGGGNALTGTASTGAGGLKWYEALSNDSTGTPQFNIPLLFGGGGGMGDGLGVGGDGGGILIIIAPWIWNAGTITSHGLVGPAGSNVGGSGGAGGSVFFFSNKVYMPTAPTFTAGGGGAGGSAAGSAGAIGYYIQGYPTINLPTS